MNDITDRVQQLRDRWVAVRDAERDERKFNVNEPRDPFGKWTSGAGGVLEKIAREITAVEARGNSRPVSPEEFQKIAGRGKEMIDRMHDNRSPITRLDRRWDKIKRDTYGEVQKSWGGATVDAHTGIPLLSSADRYALSVKPEHLNSVSVSERASEVEFSQAMDQAKEQFREILENQGSHLGIFHDDENHRIDIDPVVVVDTLDEVEAIGAYTHAIGGAYHFKSGDGFWPPHVVEAGQELPFHAFAMTPGLDELVNAGRSKDIKLGDKVTWKGPGQWRSYADRVQRGKK